MDPSRHHEFLNNNDDRARAPYYGREIQEIAPHHYYGGPSTTTTRTVSQTRKPCGCTTTTGSATSSGGVTCNGCRLQTPVDESWSPAMATTQQTEQHNQRIGIGGGGSGGGLVGDYGRMAAETSVRSNMRQSPMFLQQQHQTQQQPQQHHHNGPPSMIQPQHSNTHVGNMGNRTNYWPQANSSTQPYHAEDHLGGIPIQPHIDNSSTRRPQPPPGPMDSVYGQYKPVTSMAGSNNYSPHHMSTPTSTNSLIHRTSAIGASTASTAGNTPYLTKERIYDHQKYSSSLVNAGKMTYNTNSGANLNNSTIYDSHPHSQQQQQQHHHHPPQHMINNQTMGKAQTIDHHVINPSNLPTSKEQHPSPNYARKCPQMYAPEEQSTAHHNLYMSTPQFSSDKFTRASPQGPPPPPPPADFTNLRESPSGGGSHIQHPSCQDKYSPHAPLPPPHLRESPQFPGHSSMTRNPPNSYYGPSTNQNSSKILPPEMSPIIMKQTHTHYQYSKSPLAPPPLPLPPSSHLQQPQQQSAIPPPPPSQMAAKSLQSSHANASVLAPPLPSSQMAVVNNPQRYLIDNVKREDLEIYENPANPQQHQQQLPTSRTTAVSSGIYINPYNTPPPTGDNCCKDVAALSSSSSPYNTGSATPSYRVESPQFYPTKYGKLAMTEMTSSSNSTKQQNTSIINQNTPPPSRAPSQQRGGQHPANYYYEGNSHSAPSPAAATAASPSPSSLMATTSQTQMHHTEYITTLQGGPPIGPPPPAPMSLGHNMQQTYPTQATSAQHPHQPASLRISDEMMTTQTATQSSYDRTLPHHQSPQQQLLTKHVLPQNQHPPPHHTSSPSLQITPGSGNNPSSSSKLLTKHQKPNYRELINQKLAMRNATSEEELNMQIIKKTLNVATQNMRNSPSHNPPQTSNRGLAMQHSATNNDRIPVVSRDGLRTEVSTNSSGHKSGSVLVTNSSNNSLPSSSRLLDQPMADSPRVCIKKEDDKPSSSTSSTTTASSPLDLSMRTVKTKADSTEYKYQQTQQRISCNTPSSSTERAEGRYTLPRVDSTPIFSVHAFEPAPGPIATQRQATPSRHNSLERRNYTPPSHTSPAPPVLGGPSYNQLRTSPHIPASSSTSLSHQQYPPSRRNDLPTQTPPTNHTLQGYEKSLVIKSTPKSSNDMDLRPSQSRPSVLETNPYASVIKTEPKRTVEVAPPGIKQHPLAAVDRLPPDTSIMALPSRNLPYSQPRTNMPTQHNPNISSSVINTTLSKYSSGTCEKNPNVRKRRLQEYSHQMSMQEPVIKQNRFIDLPKQHSTLSTTKSPIPMRPADISVIAVNDSKIFEKVENVMKPNVPSKQNDIINSTGSLGGGVIASTNNATKVIVNNHFPLPIPTSSSPMVICKQEPLTPTGDNPPIKIPDVPVNNQQFNSSARIRTKAELKGFTFNPPPPSIPTTTQTELMKPGSPPSPNKELIIKQEDILDIKIKEEEIDCTPSVVTQIEMPSIPGLDDIYEERSLLDFGWSNTCNNLVEQLLTRPSPKKKSSIIVNHKIVKEPPYEMVVTSSDVVQAKNEERSLSNMESADNTTRSSFARLDGGLESGLTLNTMNQDSINSQNSGLIHKKLTKADREKKRFQQEKRLAERMKVKDSSSETEDELDKRKTDRLKKPIMKTKHKPKSPNSKGGQQSEQSNNSSNGVTDKTRFSECGSHSSTTGKEEETKPKPQPQSKTPEKLQIKKEKMEEDEVKKKDESKKKVEVKTKLPEKCDKIIKNEKNEKSEKEQKKIDVDKSKKPINTNNKTEKELNKKETPLKQQPTKAAAKESTNSSSETEDDEEEEDEEDDSEEDDEAEEQKEKEKSSTKSKLKTPSKPQTSTKKGSFFKMSLNTMTRSKRKKELELQLANSKVLRNEKVIRNSSNTTNSSSNKIKRKYTRKYNTVNSLLESGGLSRESGIMKSTRLKAKLERNGGKLNLINTAKTKANKLTPTKGESSSAKSLKNSKNPENVHERNVIDLYRFKRALKVPPSLINIKHPGAHKIAASLPDLERHAEALEAYAKKHKKLILKSKTKTQTGSSSNSGLKKNSGPSNQQEEPKSIIDLLHSRVTKASGLNVHNKTTTTTAFKPLKPCCSTTNSSNNIKPPPPAASNNNSNTTANNCAMFSETSQTTESSELQMLPELRKDSEVDEDNDNDNESTNGKKRHFSIFDTKVLATKTRTESKLQQKKENIREIFVGDDRPASAPPEITQSSDSLIEKMTYEQKYEQFLQKMNIVISADKFGRFGKSAAAKKLLPPNHTTDSLNTTLNIKQEEVDTESTSVIDADELKTDPLSNHIRKKRGKYLRRKGSSGFDYIRKKKKPTPATSSSAHNQSNGPLSNLQFAIKSEKMEQEEYRYKIKTEDDVCREIQKWVLNKGVGQSTMHKAARQGYIDVIVYCLDRLGMNPDQKDNAGYTPLHEACTNGWLNIARVLLQYGANHSEAAHSGIRPLHEASENDYEEIVRLLLSYGADPLLATYACREIQKWVLNKGVGQSTMHKAARQGYIDVIVYCLDRLGMNPDQKDNAGYTPLHEACTNGWLNIARVLLQYGANHSEAAHSGIRPLHEASENDYEEIVRLLLSYGADPLLATYAGQTPLMLAPSKTMRDILINHLVDVQNMGPERKPWKFNGPWEIYDPSECGYNVFEGAPNSICDMSRALLRKGSLNNKLMLQNNKKLQVLNTNNTTTTSTATTATAPAAEKTKTSHNLSQAANNNSTTANGETKAAATNNSKSSGSSSASSITTTSSTSSASSSNSNNKTCSIQQQQVLGTDVRPTLHKKGETTIKTVMDMDKCTVVLDKIDHLNTNTVRCLTTDKKPEILPENNSDSDGEMFEFEEADILLPPLYLLKDEGTQDKWVLLSDLCNLLKVKSKDTLLNKIYPSTSSSVAPAHKSHMRELKMSDFLEKATCLQLLCAGEKLNICASKVVLLKYNENVRNLLGVKTILMKF